LPELTRAEDFEVFWEVALTELKQEANKREGFFTWEAERVVYPLPQVTIVKVVLKALDGSPLHGYYLCPTGAGEGARVPGLIRFHGYSSNKGKLSELLLWALQGYAVLALDVRGQTGDSPDFRTYQTGAFAGWLTRGLDCPEHYYYRAVYQDAVQAVEALARRPEVDAERLGLFGNSQGAALSVAAAALREHFAPELDFVGRVRAVGLGTPFLSCLDLAYAQHTEGPLTEFSSYFRMYDPTHRTEARVFAILSYFDIMNLAPWASCQALISVGLKDGVCPPETGFALAGHWGGDGELVLYPDYEHESIDAHIERLIPFFAESLQPGQH
jgi:cephalosporin-C deacetylase